MIFRFILKLSLFILLPIHPAAGEGIRIEVLNGERMRDLEARLCAVDLIGPGSFISLAEKADFSEYGYVPAPVESLGRFEGLFIPGSYFFPGKMLQYGGRQDMALGNRNALCILTLLLHTSAARYRNLQPVKDLSLYESIILASIVEKEAVTDSHYGLIASVFYNRLAEKMSLSSCPTVEYALGYHRPFLTFADLEVESPYNLYTNKGLPPAPICFFSDGAMDGVLSPPVTDLFYFVFDWTTRELYFSGDYDNHIKNSQLSRSNFARVYGESARFEIFENKFYED